MSSKSGPLSLCQRCQEWGKINIHNMTYGDIINQAGDKSTTIKEYVSIEQLAQQPYCAICTSILNVYYMRSQVIPVLQSWPARRIVVCITGPFYLDKGISNAGKLLPRGPDISDPNYIAIRMFLKIEVSTLPLESSEENKEEPSFTYRVGQVNVAMKEVSGAPTQFTATPQFVMKYSNEATPVLCDINEWEIPFFNIQVLRDWLRHCDEYHGKQCVDQNNKNATLPVGFRVIDTHDMKILQPNGFVRYVALSYMWSGESGNDIQLEESNVEGLEVKDSIRALSIPGVIADAIALCRDLGERFLWVDRLCIVQDDSVNKPIQINAMDRIYSLANFTIVAALNTRTGLGLPGFTNRPRHPRSSAWAPPHDAEVEAQGITVQHIIDGSVGTSLWNKRAWTFQERLLSKRRLFITEYQVIYECCKGQATELLTWGNQTAYEPIAGQDSVTRGDSSFEDEETSGSQQIDEVLGFYTKSQYSGNSYAIKETSSIRDYCFWVKDYTTRQLSFGTDILNAFIGVGNALGAALSSRMLYGIPEKYLAQCLLWSTSGVAYPRGETYEIPSWSWASCLSPVLYDWRYVDYDRYFFKLASLVYFYYQDPGQGLRRLDVEERWMEDEISIEDLSRREDLPALSGRRIPGEWRTNRDWRDCPQNPWRAVEHQTLDPDACRIAAMFPGALIFNTTVASLGIDHMYYKDGIPEKYQVFNASLSNISGEHVGILSELDFDWVEAHRSAEGNKKLFDVIVVSGGLVKYSMRNNYAFFGYWDKMWLLNVMLVQRLPCKPFVARRVAVGTVTLSKWKDCNPRWETVVLH
ncbi:HET-domain-containing protein [Annulohypoxylon maeteangense]|uniref:HET-domain-containing protein n=1 Tax=Annulohypoxylon maeteangense TaxID=1927788 RepID=UPI00200879C0|nr:HET-domain-containing protein [Annulohypoxylon maeteangense]KAI0886160.1 HET-domain-containing protein [Annulohypoxylon maeteangense]